jgi:hypothetical protein
MSVHVGLVRAALRHNDRALVYVTGTSMLPTIRPGSRVTITARRFEAVCPGDVVAFALGPDVFVHRVVERDRYRLVTVGDNMPLLDPPVRVEAYLGCADGIASAPPRPTAPSAAVANLSGTTIWCASPPADRSIVARLSGLGAAFRIADPSELTRALPRSGTRIGVSSLGADVAYLVPGLIGGGDGTRHLLVGYRFGHQQHVATGCVSPDVASHHVRPGAPHQEVPSDAALRAIAELIDRAGGHDALASAA